MLKPISSSIAHDYKLTNESLGVGISGKVLLCYRIIDSKKCALKILGKNTKARREIDLHWRSKDCPNIVGIYDVYENVDQISKKKQLLMVMECMEGGDLFTRMQTRADNIFTEREAVQIVFEIASAVKYLHDRNIAHRDLKPENLLYTENGPDSKLKLTDFGFAKEVDNFNTLQTPCFTPYYVAPEILGPKKYDKSCDLWSLGVITYILLCGYPPFSSDRGQPLSPGMKSRIRTGLYIFPEVEWAKVSSNAKDFISNLLKTNPEQRLTIKQVIEHPWIAQHKEAPQTPLATIQNFIADPESLVLIKNEYGKALDLMRLDGEVTLKTLEKSNNPMLKKRQNKDKNNF